MLKRELRIFTVGEKIKDLRNKTGATQEQVGGGELTKSYISLIEKNGVPQISDAAAKIIVKNINKTILKKNINMELVTVEWLMENKSSQAQKNINKIFRELSVLKLSKVDNFKDTVDIIEEALMDDAYTNNQREEVYEKLSLIYSEKQCMNEAIFFNLKATELSFLNENLDKYILLRLDLIRNYFEIKKFDEIIYKSRLAIQIYDTYNLKINEIKYIGFNLALAYKETMQVDKCLNVLKKIKKNYNYNHEEYSRIRILEANCLMNKKMYDEAEKIYLEELEKNIFEENNINVAIIYRFLARIKIKDNIEKAESYINKALEINGLDSTEIANNSYYACEFYIKVNNPQLVNKYFRKALEQLNDYSKIEKIINKVISYYYSDSENLRLVWENIKSNNINSEKILKSLINLMKYFIKFDNQAVSEILDYIEKI